MGYANIEVHVETPFPLIINEFNFGTLRRAKKMIMMMNIEDNSTNVFLCLITNKTKKKLKPQLNFAKGTVNTFRFVFERVVFQLVHFISNVK